MLAIRTVNQGRNECLNAITWMQKPTARVVKRGHVSSAILPWVSGDAPAEDGQKLFKVLLADQVLRDAWNASREAAPQRRIRLRIDAEAAELHALLWLHRRPCMAAIADTARQKCAKWQQPTNLRACLKNRLPNGGNLPILGIWSSLLGLVLAQARKAS